MEFFFFIKELFIFNYAIILNMVFDLLFLLLSVAFYVLGERKLLGALQHRQGPMVTGLRGILQAIADGLKLIIKEILLPKKIYIYIYLIAPIISMVVPYLISRLLAFNLEFSIFEFSFSVLLFFGLGSVGIFGIIFAGWSSQNRFSFLGGVRTTAQMIAYELSTGFCLLVIVLHCKSFSFSELYSNQQIISYLVPFFPIAIIYFISIVAESNRAPFDLPEAEAELVAGFNVEYSSFPFALFFLGEYAMILLLSQTFVLLFWGTIYFKLIFFSYFLKCLIISLFFILIRGALPRVRYDQLMLFGWKYLLPFLLSFFILEFSLDSTFFLLQLLI